MRAMTLSLLSGFLAALASLCGKLSMASGETASVCQVVFSHWVSGPSAHYLCENLITVIRVVFFFLMIACNAVMWTVFTKALRLCTTTLEAAVTNTASNFFFTAIFGQTLFGEQLTLLWWLGTVMILFGLLLMHQANVETKATHTVRGPVRQKIS
ncbi:transmembrane protein 42-like [Dermacentor silvarum]|uniref:transmembrane protein 42-like n=1 Tax=Dermacentor silvarum TaxID=543639 RepID=UPI00189A24EB|nr:transmembrane protein 42-like [Dermacentor silvarum]